MYKKVMVPLDGSELAECVLPHLEFMAKSCGVQNVVFVRVVEPVHIVVGAEVDSIASAELWSQMEQEARASAETYLKGLTDRVKYEGVYIETKMLEGGRAGDLISEYARKIDLDLILIATHGRSGVRRWVWGSVADKVMRSACVPVLTVRAPGCIPGF